MAYMFLFAGIGAILCGLFAAKYIVSNFNKDSYEFNSNKTIAYIGINAIGLCIALMIWDVNNVTDIIKIHLAPKIFIIEYASSIVK